MNKDQKIIIIIITITVLIAALFGIYAYKHHDIKKCDVKESDAIKFNKEYSEYNGKKYDNTNISYLDVNLDSNNVFKYISDEELINTLNNGTGVFYFGFPMCPWCRSLVAVLNDTAKASGITQVYYVNISSMRDSYTIKDKKVVNDTKGSDTYYKLLDYLKDYLTDYKITDENGKEYKTGVKRLYAPTTVVVKNGKIVGFLEGTVDSQVKFKALSNDETKILTNKLSEMFKKISSVMCTDKAC